jgi:DNA invertase Pin-like site-specific DNA recombinase
MAHTKPLRFAALIRVSSEKQEKRGESLHTQATQIEQAVAALSGEITARYAGQEHATPGWEREQLGRLLEDASKPRRKFDAVMVADPSRWSRDNTRSEAGLDLLRNQHVRFFALLQEYNLFEPNDRAVLGLTTTMNSWQAALLAQKSVLNRIAKLQKGELAVGSLPFGRTYNKVTRQWGLDAEKARIVQEVAKRYIAGESLYDLAPEYVIGRELLRRTLMERAGTDWEVRFDSDRFNIHVAVNVAIPPLLDVETIQAVKRTAQANKSYKHGHIKNQYLFSRMVFCGVCHRAMRGCTTKGNRYYQHTYESPNCLEGSVRADDLEDVAMRHLFDTFGNPQALKRAIEEATPNNRKIEEARKRLERIAQDLAKIETARDRILGFVVRGTITDRQAEKQLNELTDREHRLQEEVEQLSQQVECVPTANAIAASVQDLTKQFRRRVSAKPRLVARSFDLMTWEDKRSLAQTVFAGKLPDGRRMGIYIDRLEGQQGKHHRKWNFRILGQLIDEQGFFPMSSSQRDARFDHSDEEPDVIPRARRSSTPR